MSRGPCPRCFAVGKIGTGECFTCRGEGWLEGAPGDSVYVAYHVTGPGQLREIARETSREDLARAIDAVALHGYPDTYGGRRFLLAPFDLEIVRRQRVAFTPELQARAEGRARKREAETRAEVSAQVKREMTGHYKS